MLPWSEKRPSYEEYTGIKSAAQPAAMLDMRLRAGAKGLRSISLKEHLAAQRRR